MKSEEYRGKTDRQRDAESLMAKADKHLAESCAILDRLDAYFLENVRGYVSKSFLTRPYSEIKDLL